MDSHSVLFNNNSNFNDPDVDFGFHIAGGILAATADSDGSLVLDQDFMSRFNHRGQHDDDGDLDVKPSVVLRMLATTKHGSSLTDLHSLTGIPNMIHLDDDETRDNMDSKEGMEEEDDDEDDEQEEEAIVIQTMYESMTSTELRETCASIGVDYRGLKKRLLIALLMEHIKTGWAVSYLSTLQLKELRRECMNLGRSSAGGLVQLAERIVVALMERKKSSPKLYGRNSISSNKGRGGCPCPLPLVKK